MRPTKWRQREEERDLVHVEDDIEKVESNYINVVRIFVDQKEAYDAYNS